MQQLREEKKKRERERERERERGRKRNKKKGTGRVENRKTEGSGEKAGLRGSPAGLNNAGQNAADHPSPHFSERCEIAARRVSEGERERRREDGAGGRRELGFLFKCP